MGDAILASRAGPLTTLTLNRPEKLNALDRSALRSFRDALARAAADPETRAVALAGAGEKAFCVGADLAEVRTLTPAEALDFARLGQSVCDAVAGLDVPTVALLRGHALGGGLELALACDVRIAARGSRLGLPEVNVGLLPGWGGTQRLPRLVGMALAREMVLTGEAVGADEALRIGLVNRVVEPEGMAEAVEGLVQKIAARSPVPLRLAKEALRGAWPGLEEGLARERALFSHLFSTGDTREGLAAFAEKRKAVYRGK
ncbi:MAG: enoyl-CoA hydratase-related protein [Halobacteria archaeon]